MSTCERRPRMAGALTTVLVGAALLLSSSCVTSVSSIRLGWTSSLSSHEYSATYATWNGNTSVPIAVQEKQVTFSYRVRIDKGGLSIKVQDPQGKTLWQATLHHTDVGGSMVSTPTTGSYRLVVEGQNTGGSFDIRWV
jgi:hypothetical protein